jgi:hypothetical protein
MSFTHYDLGQRVPGDMVEVVLSGSAANVRLMDSQNFSNYQSGRQYRFFGGLAPIRLQVSNPGHWHVAIDLNGLQGRTNSTIRIISA